MNGPVLEPRTLTRQATEYIESLVVEGNLPEGSGRRGDSLAASIDAQRAIRDAVAAHDPAAAAGAMQHHLDRALVDLLAVPHPGGG